MWSSIDKSSVDSLLLIRPVCGFWALVTITSIRLARLLQGVAKARHRADIRDSAGHCVGDRWGRDDKDTGPLEVRC